MSRKGNCCDNAVAESTFGTVEAELLTEDRASMAESYNTLDIHEPRPPLSTTNRRPTMRTADCDWFGLRMAPLEREHG